MLYNLIFNQVKLFGYFPSPPKNKLCDFSIGTVIYEFTDTIYDHYKQKHNKFCILNLVETFIYVLADRIMSSTFAVFKKENAKSNKILLTFPHS